MIFGWPTFKLCVTPPFSINFIYQIENQVNDYRLMGASSLNSCCSALRFLSSVLLIIACLFGLFILTVLMYVALFVNLRLLTTHLVTSNCNLSRSVPNGKQYKHQNTLSCSSHFMVKRAVSWINFWTCKNICVLFSSLRMHCQIIK